MVEKIFEDLMASQIHGYFFTFVRNVVFESSVQDYITITLFLACFVLALNEHSFKNEDEWVSCTLGFFFILCSVVYFHVTTFLEEMLNL